MIALFLVSLLFAFCLTGKGVAQVQTPSASQPGDSLLSLSQESLDFGIVRIGKKVSKTIKITNIWTENLAVSVQTEGTDYKIAGRSSFIIRPQRSYTLRVTGSPTQAGLTTAGALEESGPSGLESPESPVISASGEAAVNVTVDPGILKINPCGSAGVPSPCTTLEVPLTMLIAPSKGLYLAIEGQFGFRRVDWLWNAAEFGVLKTTLTRNTIDCGGGSCEGQTAVDKSGTITETGRVCTLTASETLPYRVGGFLKNRILFLSFVTPSQQPTGSSTVCCPDTSCQTTTQPPEPNPSFAILPVELQIPYQDGASAVLDVPASVQAQGYSGTTVVTVYIVR